MATWNELNKQAGGTTPTYNTSSWDSLNASAKQSYQPYVPEPVKPSLTSKIVSGVKSYAKASADTVGNVVKFAKNPITTTQSGIKKYFLDPYIQNIEKAGAGLYDLVKGNAPTKVKGAAELTTGTVGAVLNPITGLFGLASQTPGAKQAADVINIPFIITGKIGEFTAGKAVDMIPESFVSKESKAIFKQPIEELGSLAGQIFLGGRILKRLEDFSINKKEVTPEISKQIVNEALNEAQKMDTVTPTERYTQYREKMGYEPYVDPATLPVIEYGTRAKETLPTIQIGARTTKPGVSETLKYEPVKPTLRPQPTNVLQTLAPTPSPRILDIVTGKNKVEPIQNVPMEQVQPTTGTTIQSLGTEQYKTTKLASSIAEGFKDLIKPTESELSQYKTEANFMKVQAQKALDLSKSDPVFFDKIARGESPAPIGLREGSIWGVAKRLAQESGDVNKVLELSKSSVGTLASEAGQLVKSFDTPKSELDVVERIKEINNSWKNDILKDKNYEKVLKEEKAKLAPVEKISPKTWSEFIDNLTC